MVPKLFFLYAFPSNFYQLLSSCTSCILLFFVVLFLKVHVPRAEHVLWLLPFCYPLSFLGEMCLTFGKHSTVKDMEACGQGRDNKGKESKVVELCIDTGFF